MIGNALKVRKTEGLLFGIEVVLYLFLGGLGGGLSVTAGVAGSSVLRQFSGDDPLLQYCGPMRSAFIVAGASLVLGSLLLLADSGNFSALVYLFFTPHYNYLSIGAWLIVIDIGLCFVLVMFWGARAKGYSILVSRVLHALCVLVGSAVALYTGLFLSSMRAVPLWNTPWLPALFVLSAISCGTVLFLALIQASDRASTFLYYKKLLARIDILVVVLELLCATAMVLSLVAGQASGSTAATGAASALNMVSGEYAWVWWSGFVGLGIIATGMLDALVVRSKDNWTGRIWPTLGISVCVLVGALALRYCLIMAGAHPALGS